MIATAAYDERVFIAPDGTVFSRTRIGEYRGGVCISDACLTVGECRGAGVEPGPGNVTSQHPEGDEP